MPGWIPSCPPGARGRCWCHCRDIKRNKERIDPEDQHREDPIPAGMLEEARGEAQPLVLPAATGMGD